MYNNTIPALAIAWLLLAPPTALATDTDGNYAVWGHGKRPCISYTEARSRDASNFEHYAMGYLTALNIHMEDTYNISGSMTLAEILQWLDNYCAGHPMTAFESALGEFALDQFKTRSKQAKNSGWR